MVVKVVKCSYIGLLVLLVVACSGKKQEVVLGKPVKLEFYATYFMSEIAGSWAEAIMVADAKRELISAGDTNLRNIPLEELNKQARLEQLVHPIGEFALGSVKEKDIEKVDSILRIPEVKELFPDDLVFMWSMKPDGAAKVDGEAGFVLYAIKLPNTKKEAFNGKHIKEVSVGYDEQSARITIDLIMTKKGTSLWAQMTSDNINRIIAMTIDGRVISAPRVMNAITGGATQISGDFSKQEAEELAAGIRAGSSRKL